ncbi:MAG: C-terminal helicase domain-containing protein [Gemmatimonadota bacterium]
MELLKQGHMDDALVFTRTKHRADRLAKLLNRNGIAAERIHGNRSQAQRTRVLAGFKAGEFRVLVATDIAARGIDVEALWPRRSRTKQPQAAHALDASASGEVAVRRGLSGPVAPGGCEAGAPTLWFPPDRPVAP